VAIRFGVSSTVKNRLPRYSNFWDGTAVFSPFTATGSYDALATYTVPSGGVSTITFAGLPTGGQYTHLQIRGILRSTRNDPYTYGSIKFNGEGTTTNYAYHHLVGAGSGTPTSGGDFNVAAIDINQIVAASSMSDNFTSIVIDVLDYTSTAKYKTVRHLYGDDRNSESAYHGHINFSSGLWKNTAAINQITVSDNVANWAEYSTLSIYGVK